MPSSSKKQEKSCNHPCEGCGKYRWYNLYETSRGRHLSGFCQPCSIKSYNILKIKQPIEIKKLKQAEHFQKNKKEYYEYYVHYRERIKKETIEAYGGYCKNCGETDLIVLNIDHIYNDGYKDKRQGISGGFKLYQKLKREGYPKGRHQVLCFNCNYRKEHKRRQDAFYLRQAG
jgi:hypothetical protein